MTDALATLAIDGGTPVRAEPWPDAPEVEPAADPDPVPVLEAALAETLGLPSTALVAYASVEEAYRVVLGAPSGGRVEVIVPALCERRAAEEARAGGWRVVPAAVAPETGALSPGGLARAAGPLAGSVVVGHPFGHPAPLDDLVRAAEERSLQIVEDISGALGAAFRGVPVGRAGQAAMMAGRPGHPITHGAYVAASDAGEAAALRETRTEAPGDAEAQTALAQVRALDEELAHRRHLAWELTFALRGMKGLAPMLHGRWVRHAYARYVVRLRSSVWRRSLDDTLAALRAEGVPAARACEPSLHLDARVRAALPDDPRVTDDVFAAASRLPDELIAIPLHRGLTSRDMGRVAAAFRKVEAQSV